MKNSVRITLILICTVLSSQKSIAQQKQSVNGKIIVNPYYSRTESKKINVTDAEWKKVLSPALYAVAREASTERAFSGTYNKFSKSGT